VDVLDMTIKVALLGEDFIAMFTLGRFMNSQVEVDHLHVSLHTMFSGKAGGTMRTDEHIFDANDLGLSLYGHSLFFFTVGIHGVSSHRFKITREERSLGSAEKLQRKFLIEELSEYST